MSFKFLLSGFTLVMRHNLLEILVDKMNFPVLVISCYFTFWVISVNVVEN